MALPKHLRFPSRREIAAVLKFGHSSRSPLGRVVRLASRNERGRILFVVSARTAKRSSHRHRIQRRLDGWATRNFRGALRRFHTVVYVWPGPAASSRAQLHRLADGAFRLLAQHRKP